MTAALGVALAAALAAGTAATATPADAGEAPPYYPFAVRLRFAPELLRATFEHTRKTPTAPPGRAVTVPIGEQAREAWVAGARRMFRSEPGAAPRLELDVSLSSADVEIAAGVSFALVEHVVAIRTAEGRELARHALRGVERLRDSDRRTVPRAFARAAEAALREFEAAFDQSAAVGAWLAENGLPRRARLAGIPAQPPPPRRPLVGFLELDLGRVAGTAKGAPSLALRAGASGRAFLAALTLEAWRSSFGADPGFATPRDDVRLDVLAAGLDVGALRRSPSQDLEFQAGLGFHLLRAEATLEYWVVAGSSSRSMSMSELEPATSAFAALLWAGARAPWGGRSRFRFEARRWFGSTIELASLRRDVALAQASFSLSVGAELP